MLISTLRRALLVAALVFPPPAGAAEIPPLGARVTDLTGTLTADQRAGLEARLAAFETRKGTQVAVLLVPSTRPEPIEAYSMRVVEQWKLGRKGIDDGALLIVAKDDRRVRIEVGYGLEGVLPDALGKRIVEEAITPRFKAGDFHGGIAAGVDRMLSVIEGEPLPPPGRGGLPAGGSAGWFELVIPAVIVAMVVGGMLRALFGRFLGSGLVGGAAGLLAYLLIGLAGALLIGFIVFFISLFAGGLGRVGGSGWPAGRGWHTGGWGSGGGFGGRGGGFGGGGGGFGGGGASGSW